MGELDRSLVRSRVTTSSSLGGDQQHAHLLDSISPRALSPCLWSGTDERCPRKGDLGFCRLDLGWRRLLAGGGRRWARSLRRRGHSGRRRVR